MKYANSGSFFYETPRATSLGVTASSRNMAYEDYTLPGQDIPISTQLNREEQDISSEFYYQIFTDTFFFLRGVYTEYKFENLAWLPRIETPIHTRHLQVCVFHF